MSETLHLRAKAVVYNLEPYSLQKIGPKAFAFPSINFTLDTESVS